MRLQAWAYSNNCVVVGAEGEEGEEGEAAEEGGEVAGDGE